MATKSQRQGGPGGTLSSLNVAIQGITIAKEDPSTTPAKTVFALVGSLLTVIRVCSFFRDEIFKSHKYQGLDGQ